MEEGSPMQDDRSATFLQPLLLFCSSLPESFPPFAAIFFFLTPCGGEAEEKARDVDARLGWGARCPAKADQEGPSMYSTCGAALHGGRRRPVGWILHGSSSISLPLCSSQLPLRHASPARSL